MFDIKTTEGRSETACWVRVLRDEGHTVAEIAAILELNESTVQSIEDIAEKEYEETMKECAKGGLV